MTIILDDLSARALDAASATLPINGTWSANASLPPDGPAVVAHACDGTTAAIFVNPAFLDSGSGVEIASDLRPFAENLLGPLDSITDQPVEVAAAVAIGGTTVGLSDGSETLLAVSVLSPPSETPQAPPATRGIDRLKDVAMQVTAELGQIRMRVSDVLGLAPGSIVTLDRPAGAPVDLMVNGTIIGRAEVVVVDDEYAVRVTEVIGHEDSALPS